MSQESSYTLADARLNTEAVINPALLTLGGKAIDSKGQVGGYPNLKATAQKFDQSQWDMDLMKKESKSHS